VFAELAGPVFEQLAMLVQVSGSSSTRVIHHEQAVTASPTSTTGEAAGVDIDNVNPCELLTDDEVAGLMGVAPVEERLLLPPSSSVALGPYAGASCRWTSAEDDRGVSEHMGLDVYRAEADSLEFVSAWNPWGYMASEPLDGVGDQARLLLDVGGGVLAGGFELTTQPGTFEGIVVEESGVGIRISFPNVRNQPSTSNGLIAAATAALARL
jgi:hypothetical protein